VSYVVRFIDRIVNELAVIDNALNFQ